MKNNLPLKPSQHLKTDQDQLKLTVRLFLYIRVKFTIAMPPPLSLSFSFSCSCFLIYLLLFSCFSFLLLHWPIWLNGCVFIDELSACVFESRYCHLNFRYGACFEQGVP